MSRAASLWLAPAFLAVQLLSFSAQAALHGEEHAGYFLNFGAGLAYQDAGRVATDVTGGTSLLGNSYFTLAFSPRFSFGGSWGLAPFLSYTPVGSKGADDGEKTRLITVDLRLFRLFGPVDLHTGPGVLFQTISGSGGTASLNNGTGTTVFGLPASSSTSRYFYWEGGLGLGVSRLRADFDVLVTDTLSARRAVYATLILSLGFF